MAAVVVVAAADGLGRCFCLDHLSSGSGCENSAALYLDCLLKETKMLGTD